MTFLRHLVLMLLFLCSPLLLWSTRAMADVDHTGELVAVVVKDVLEPELSSQIDRLVADLQNEGYSTKEIITGVNSAQDLWSILSTEFNDENQNLVGAILIGDLPNGRCDSTTDAAYWNMSEYCNLNQFDIWVSRIKGSVQQIQWSMDAHHYYRVGESRLPLGARFLMDAYPDMESYYYPNSGANALEVWPEVLKASLYNDGVFGSIFGDWKFGAELLDETMHGSAFASRTDHLAGHPCQTRFNLITSCSQAGSAWSLTATRGGGAVFSVGATTTTYTGAFVIMRSNFQSTTFRQYLAEGHSFGYGLVHSYPFDDRYRAMFYGDLSLPVLATAANMPPVINSFSADPTTGTAPLTVEFSVDASDPDDSIVLHEWFCEGYRQNRVIMEPQYTNTSPSQSHTFQRAHRYLAEVQVVDQFRARSWAETVIAVKPTPGAALRINCGHSSRYAVEEFDYMDNSGKLWLHDQDKLNDGTWGWSSNRDVNSVIGGDIAGTDDDPVFAYYRATRDGSFTYSITLPDGRYKVTLGFAEPSASVAVGQRLIDVQMEEETWLSGFDIMAQAGAPKTAVTTQATVELTDGELSITVAPNEASAEEAVLSNITVEPDECAENCDDGVFCNGMETCQAGGNCAQGAAPCVPDDIECTDTCNEDSRDCNVIQEGFCLIDGVCYAQGSTDPSNPCRICQPDLDPKAWSANDGASCDDGLWCDGSERCAGDTCIHENTPCEDDSLDCTVTCDEDLDACNVIQQDFCLIDGVCHAEDEIAPDNLCLICRPGVNQNSWSANDGVSCDDGLWCNGAEVCVDGACTHQNPPCSDDGLDCTETCDEAAGECNKLLDQWCLIGGSCFAQGDINSDNPCQACLSEQNDRNWSNNDGIACDDGNSCTGPDLCQAAVCQGEAITGCCSQDSDCDDGNDCTQDICHVDDGTCSNEILADHCSIGQSCVASGEFNPQNSCEHCDPSVSTRMWTSLSDGALCDDGLWCNEGESCMEGVCVGGESKDCDDGLDCTEDTCDEAQGGCQAVLASGWCLIENTCVQSGSSKPENPCLVCDPSIDSGTWSAANGQLCDDGDPCTTDDSCVDGQCSGLALCDSSCPCEPDRAGTKIVGKFGCGCDSTGGSFDGVIFFLMLMCLMFFRRQS